MKRIFRKESGSMKKVFTFLFSICLFTMVASASNESPTIKSEIVKDGSFDFNVTLTDMNLSTNMEYEWAIVKNQAATPEDNSWVTINNWTNNKVELNLDFSDDKIYSVLSKSDIAYLIIREKTSKNVITDHAKIDVSIPYAYGAVPYLNDNGGWYLPRVFDNSSLYDLGAVSKIIAIKITNQDIINGYLNLKDESGNINKNKLAEYINSLNLNNNDIPSSFIDGATSGVYSFSEEIGITEKAIYFVWGSQSYGSSKTVYGVTIYNNGYDGSNDNVEIINNDDNTDSNVIVSSNDKKEVENPKTGIITLGVGVTVLLALSVVTFIVIRKKSRFPQSL